MLETLLIGTRKRLAPGTLSCGVLLSIGCSGSSSNTGPSDFDVSDAIPLEGGSTLVFQDGGSLEAQRTSIERITKETLTVVRALIPVDGVTILIDAGAANVNSGARFRGAGGCGDDDSHHVQPELGGPRRHARRGALPATGP